MRLSDEQLNEFIRLYAEELGEALSLPEAREVANNLLELYLIFLTRTPREIREEEEGAADHIASSSTTAT